MKHDWLRLLLFFMTGFSVSAYAQHSFQVKGVLVDSLTNEGEPYATIRISTMKNPDKPVQLAITGQDGKFNEKLRSAGEYIISFTSVGKNPVQKEFTLTDAVKSVDLGRIMISESAEMLKGVEIVAQKPLVKAEIDKVTYSIEDDPDSKTNSTLEMLRKVPLVTVDGEDNVKVNGSSSFKVHVNGKPNNMMSNNPKEVLKSLPANSVKSIEVITDPGAKYDAEGIGGILNIITTDNAGLQGYTATFNAGIDNRGFDAGAYGTVKVGKFTVTGNYLLSDSKSPRGYSDSGREDYTSDEYKYLNTEGSSKGGNLFQFGSMEGSYEIDTLNLVTFSMQMFGGTSDHNGVSSTQMLNAQHEHAYSYDMVNRGKSGFGSIGANFDYQHSFKKKGEYLTFSYRYSGSPNDSEAHTDYENIKDYPYDMNFMRNQYYDNDAHTDEHTFQLDYVNPINQMHDIDFGAKYILRNNKSDSRVYKEYDGVYQEDNNLTDVFNQTQNILAAYADYKVKWKKLAAKAGVRYEHTFMDVEYDKLAEKNFKADFDDLVPSLMLSYQLGPTQTLR